MKRFLFFTIIFSILCVTSLGSAQDLSYVEDLFSLRDSFSQHCSSISKTLSEKAPENARDLERIFELNISTMTTIEAYFRIFRIVFTQQRDPTRQDLEVASEWLQFINNQCSYDLEFLNEALAKDPQNIIRKHLEIAKKNIKRLVDISRKGIDANSRVRQ